MTDEELQKLLEAEDAGEDSLVSELEQLRDDTQPSPSFTARVMKDVDQRQRGIFARMRDTVLRPRLLRFNVAMALPVGVAATLLVALVLRDSGPQHAPVATADSARASVEPAHDAVMVRFSLAAPGATRVSVAGDFNEWNAGAAVMSDGDGDGIWTVSVPVEPGRYAYMFVIDGQQWRVDPEAEALQPDGFGGQNAVLRL